LRTAVWTGDTRDTRPQADLGRHLFSGARFRPVSQLTNSTRRAILSPTEIEGPTMSQAISLSRREWLQASGALLVTATGALPGTLQAEGAQPAGFGAAKPALHPAELDSWIAVGRDGRITAYFGKTDAGQGIDVAVAQIVAEELDVSFGKVAVVMGDSGLTINQGGASNSTGIKAGAQQLRHAAAEARRILLEAAARQWDVAPEALMVEDGLVKSSSDPTRQISYAELVGGRYFDRKLEWNNERGNALEIRGRAKPKRVSDYKIVGKSIPRPDVAGKTFGTIDYVTDVRLPGMLHARVIRPPAAGAAPLAVDASSLDGTGARLVRIKDFIAVVADKEWDAVRGAQALKVSWTSVAPPFPGHDGLYEHIRAARPTNAMTVVKADGIDAVFAGAARTIEAEYEWPFQSHASMGPACALVEVAGDAATVYTASAKPHYAAEGVARMLGLKIENVRAIWVRGPGAYGRNDADDTAAEAALIARATGRPVRLQGMRHDGIAFDPKAPAGVHAARAAFDRDGNVLAYEFAAKAFSTVDVYSNGSKPKDLWVGQLLGESNAAREYTFNVPADSYTFPSMQTGWQTIAPLLESASPLRTSHMRDTAGPQLHFASESFIDEMAFAAKRDPVAFRLQYLSKEREKAALKAVAERAGWEPRDRPRKILAGGRRVGQGIAYAQRGGTVVAIVAEIEVDPASGRIRARKFTVAHDCGLIINPGELRRVIEGNIVQALSRTLYEEVQFDRAKVTSVDWATYPIVEMADAPEAIDIVLIDRPEIAPSGAGEPGSRPVAAAIANALYDATGARLRRVPFTPARVKAALAALG
jgi:nicotinate dehydrogenase subunit B